MSNNHISFAKLVFLALLFSPAWGFWWFNTDPYAQGIFSSVVEVLLRHKIWASIVYASVCLLALMSFVLTSFIRNAAIRITLMTIMLAGWAFELFLLDINGTFSNQNIIFVLWQELAYAKEMAGSFAGMIFRDVTAVMILGVVLCASPAPRFSVSGACGLLPIASGALVAGAIMYTKGSTLTHDFPIPFGTYSNAAIVMLGNNITTLDNSAWNYRPAGGVVIDQNVKIEGPIRPNFDKIVVIMDESVRGDYILEATHNTTPFLNAADHLVNFGVAISASNCSTVSRMIFRFGMRRSDLPAGWPEGLRKPTFWQLAHRAGYKTVYIDAWGSQLSFHSGFSVAEKTLIDSETNIVKKPAYLRDHELVDKIIDALKQDAPTFIYVDKYGVHYPYSDKYPSAFKRFSTSGAAESSDNRGVGGFGWREAMIGHYQNAIFWSVDEFFRKLLPAVDLSKTLIIYTSDHGQNLKSGNNWSHCTSTPNVSPAEAYVPILAITSEPKFERLLAEAAARGFGRFSHFEGFPTLLLAMGFDARWVNKTYGPSLIDSPAPDREFLIGSPLYQPMMIPTVSNVGRTWPPMFGDEK
jgi:glucan phosphoethanolaminetransferase (alkaline phosphatase superfamily)